MVIIDCFHVAIMRFQYGVVVFNVNDIQEGVQGQTYLEPFLLYLMGQKTQII